MAGFSSTYLANELLDHVFNNASYTSPTTVYLALYTTNPTAADTGTEVTGGSYARVAIAFGVASSGAITTSTEYTFSDLPTANITHWGVRDASTAGNLLIYGPFGTTISANAGDTVKLASGDIDISLVTS